MKTPKRFDNAVSKLYKAWIDGSFNFFSCNHCAVGVICGGSSGWTISVWYCNMTHTSLFENNDAAVTRSKEIVYATGYSPEEMALLEKRYLEGAASGAVDVHDTKLGLRSAIEFLAELDNIEVPNKWIESFEFKKEKV